MNKIVNLAYVSIFLYLSLVITCFYFAQSFWDFQTGELRGGRYATPKFVFFVVLGLSAMFDIPLFVGCIVQDGPVDCEWNSPSYVTFWLFHVFATCGYAYAIITPPILWSDIIQGKDGNLWNSAYPVDSTKMFFRIVFSLFCLNELVTIIGAGMYQNPNHQADYTKSNAIGSISEAFSPIITTTVTVGCLWSGIALQRHVVSVGLRGSTQFKILAQLNITMLIIAVTYIMRSLLVLCLYDPMPYEYVRLFHPLRSSFFLWLLWTRWLPCVFCSFCLVHEMRFKSAGTQNAPGSAPASPGTMTQGLLQPGERGSSIINNPRSSVRRTQSAESGRSNDSALEETYSMLSSVDFPDSASDSSYIVSPDGSPERAGPRRKRVDVGMGGGMRGHDVETGDRRSHKRAIQQQLRFDVAGAVGGSSSAGGSFPGVSGETARESLRTDSASGSDTDFYSGSGNRYSPPRNSIDHFFTFAAPGLHHLAPAGQQQSQQQGFPPRSANIPIQAACGTGAGALSPLVSSSGGGGTSANVNIQINSAAAATGASAGTSSSGSGRPVASFSPPTWRGPMEASNFINDDERTSPEISSKTL